jgi:hypothetical protein
VYFLLWRLYRRLYPLISRVTPDDLAMIGDDMAAKAAEIRKARAAEAAAKSRIEERRRLLAESQAYIEVERARNQP